jgi:hypothetical protein
MPDSNDTIRGYVPAGSKSTMTTSYQHTPRSASSSHKVKSHRSEKNKSPVVVKKQTSESGILTPHGNDKCPPCPQEGKAKSISGSSAASTASKEDHKVMSIIDDSGSRQFRLLQMWQIRKAQELAANGILGLFEIDYVLCTFDSIGLFEVKALRWFDTETGFFWQDDQTGEELKPRHPWKRCEKLVWDQTNGAFLGVQDRTRVDHIERPPLQVPEAGPNVSDTPNGLRPGCDPMWF